MLRSVPRRPQSGRRSPKWPPVSHRKSRRSSILALASSPLPPTLPDGLKPLPGNASLTTEQLQELLSLSLKIQAPTDVFKFGEYVFDYQPAPHHRELVEFV